MCRGLPGGWGNAPEFLQPRVPYCAPFHSRLESAAHWSTLPPNARPLAGRRAHYAPSRPSIGPPDPSIESASNNVRQERPIKFDALEMQFDAMRK